MPVQAKKRLLFKNQEKKNHRCRTNKRSPTTKATPLWTGGNLLDPVLFWSDTSYPFGGVINHDVNLPLVKRTVTDSRLYAIGEVITTAVQMVTFALRAFDVYVDFVYFVGIDHVVGWNILHYSLLKYFVFKYFLR